MKKLLSDDPPKHPTMKLRWITRQVEEQAGILTPVKVLQQLFIGLDGEEYWEDVPVEEG